MSVSAKKGTRGNASRVCVPIDRHVALSRHVSLVPKSGNVGEPTNRYRGFILEKHSPLSVFSMSKKRYRKVEANCLSRKPLTEATTCLLERYSLEDIPFPALQRLAVLGTNPSELPVSVKQMALIRATFPFDFLLNLRLRPDSASLLTSLKDFLSRKPLCYYEDIWINFWDHWHLIARCSLILFRCTSVLVISCEIYCRSACL